MYPLRQTAFLGSSDSASSSPASCAPSIYALPLTAISYLSSSNPTNRRNVPRLKKHKGGENSLADYIHGGRPRTGAQGPRFPGSFVRVSTVSSFIHALLSLGGYNHDPGSFGRLSQVLSSLGRYSHYPGSLGELSQVLSSRGRYSHCPRSLRNLSHAFSPLGTYSHDPKSLRKVLHVLSVFRAGIPFRPFPGTAHTT